MLARPAADEGHHAECLQGLRPKKVSTSNASKTCGRGRSSHGMLANLSQHAQGGCRLRIVAAHLPDLQGALLVELNGPARRGEDSNTCGHPLVPHSWWSALAKCLAASLPSTGLCSHDYDWRMHVPTSVTSLLRATPNVGCPSLVGSHCGVAERAVPSL